MTDVREPDLAVEPERYELFAGPAYRFTVGRRDFVKAFGAGLVVALASPRNYALQESGRGRGDRMPADLGAWLHIGKDGRVTVYSGKAEVGQNVRTSLTQAVAEELRVPMASISMVLGDTDLTPYDAGTFGSRSTPIMAPQLHKVASTARELLVDLAAASWQCDRAALRVSDGKIWETASGKAATYGDLVGDQKLTKTIAADAKITPTAQWRICGTTQPKVNGRDSVTGKHEYTVDMKRPSLVYGKVLRPSAIGATLSSVDTAEASKLEGVTVVRDGDFVGVTAPSEYRAQQALFALNAEWKTSPQPSTRELFDYLKKNPTTGEGFEGRSQNVAGSIEQGLADADVKLQQSYTVAYIAHAPLEPRSAVAEWRDGKLTVWTGTQRPFGVRSELAEALHVPEDRIRVLVPDTGSGYGGKHSGEVAVEAARLAKGAGKPVKLVWTRVEEFSWAYFRPAGVIDVSSGVRKDGRVTSWEFHNYNSGTAAIRTLYDIPNQKIEFHPSRSPLRQGSYRGLAATANHFARETHMDELAVAVGLDPLEFRLKNLKDERLKAVLQAAAGRFGWARSKPEKGRGFGLACGFEKGGYVATCAEVAVDREGAPPRILRVTTAFECGAVVNPDHLKNQIEGSVIMGIGGALFESISFANGKILNPRFSQYRVPRFSDVPVLETVLVDRKDLPSAGAGETPIVGLAPAVGNAIFAATGKRLRSLPLTSGA